VGYDHPRGGKADLQATDSEGLIVFEITVSFYGADANKKEKWPGQLERLRTLVEKGHAEQGVAFSTCSGYGDDALSCLTGRLRPPRWNRVGPSKLLETAPLKLFVATLNGGVRSRPNEVQ
jgi:hypothetical protein